MTDKIKIGIFSCTINPHNMRGASRLFNAIFQWLSVHPEVDLYILEERVRYEISPNETLYFFSRPGSQNAAVSTGKNKGGLAQMCFSALTTIQRARNRIQTAQKVYRESAPYPFRKIFHPLARIVSGVFDALLNRSEEGLKRMTARINAEGTEKLSWKTIFLHLFFFKEDRFSNDGISIDVLNINQLDVILNFWWFHTPHGNPALGMFKPEKTIMYSWFLDAIPLRVPHWQEGLIGETEFRFHVQNHLRMCDRVVAISECAAEDARIFFSVPQRQLTVIPCGLYEEDFATPVEVEDEDPKMVLGVDTNVPIILVLGVQEPSKNTLNILKALEIMAEDGFANFQCVLIGAHEGFNPQQKFGHVIETLRKHIKVTFLGPLYEVHKRKLLFHSQLLLYPSLWEGFGIPPLEAMAAGLPVVVSDVASLPEVCGENVLYCDPYDPRDIAYKAMHILTLSAEAKEHLTKAAREYARGWLWTERAIPALLEDIRRTAGLKQAVRIEDEKKRLRI